MIIQYFIKILSEQASAVAVLLSGTQVCVYLRPLGINKLKLERFKP